VTSRRDELPRPTGHRHLLAGRTIYGRDARGYDAGRPEYPEWIYEAITERCGFSPGVRSLVGRGGLYSNRLLLTRRATTVG
jgi:hypothetical protein